MPETSLSVTAFDAAAATQTYLATLAGDARARSDAYFEGGYLLDGLDAGVGIAIALLLVATGLSAGLRTRLESWLRRRPLVVLVHSACYLAAVFVLGLPFAIYRGFFREHAYGLANQGFGAWIGERVLSLGVSVLLFAPFLVAFYAVLRRWPRTWWLGATGLSTLFLAFSILVTPVFIAPLFNTYTPMEPGPLRNDILLLAQANGVPADDVFVQDVSRQSNRITANVSGLFGTTRISLADTLLERVTPAEVRAVMGHEIGHYALGHPMEILVTLSALFLIAFALANPVFDWVNVRFGQRWGLRGIDDVAGLPLLVGLLGLFLFVATPVTNTIVRSNEAEADLFGLNAAREPDAFAASAMRLSAYRKIEPSPLEEQLFFDHPSGHSRVSMAMTWKAAELASGATDLDPSPAPLAPMVAEALRTEQAERHTPAVAAPIRDRE